MAKHRVDRDRVRALLLQGKGAAEVARLAKCSKTSVQTIRRALHERGDLPPSGPSPFAAPAGNSKGSTAAANPHGIQNETAMIRATAEKLTAQHDLAALRRRIHKERAVEAQEELEEEERADARAQVQAKAERREQARVRAEWVALCARAGVNPNRYNPSAAGEPLYQQFEQVARDREAQQKFWADWTERDRRNHESFLRTLEAPTAAAAAPIATPEPAAAHDVRWMSCRSCGERFLVEDGLLPRCPECGERLRRSRSV